MNREVQMPNIQNSSTSGNGKVDERSKPEEIDLCAATGSYGQTQPIFEQVLSSEEAAALLNIHPKTLQRLARIGEIPGFRIGKLWGFRASALNRWLDSKTSF